MWEVLSRQIPFKGNCSFWGLFFFHIILCSYFTLFESLICVCLCSEVTNGIQIMFSVLRGLRPDTSLESLSADIPSRETLINLMTAGWNANPDERPSFQSMLIQMTKVRTANGTVVLCYIFGRI